VLKSADAFGVNIMTETEVRIAAAEAIAEMETEVALWQTLGGPPAINLCVQNDATAAQALALPLFAAIAWRLDSARSSAKVSWSHCVTVRAYRFTIIIGKRLADVLSRLSRHASKLTQVCDRLSIRLFDGCSLLEQRSSQKRPNSEPFPPTIV
jgi:hypothetical protein